MTRQVILDRLKAEAPALRVRYGLRTPGVFGSVARGDDHEKSDLDILVTFEGKATFDRFMDLKLYLEDTFVRSVDLSHPRHPSPRNEGRSRARPHPCPVISNRIWPTSRRPPILLDQQRHPLGRDQDKDP